MAEITTRDAAGKSLARGAIGLREVLFQSVTAMGPAGAVATAVVVGATYSGGALSLAVIFAFITCLTVAVSIGQLAKHLPSAGSIYTYPARALHPTIGFLVGWGYALAAATWGPGIGLMMSVQVAGVLTRGDGLAFEFTWTAVFFIAACIVLFLGYRGVQVSAETSTVLGAIEIVVFLILALSLIIIAGHANTLAPFGLKLATANGYNGLAGVFAGAVYTVQAFVGFETAASLAEEARDPRRTISRATLLACGAIGAFYVLTTYAATVNFGAVRFQQFADSPNGGSWFALARSAWGAGWVIVFIAVVNSNFAAQVAFSNAATRTWFALARIQLLPEPLSRTHPRWKSPHVASLLQFVYTLALGAIAGGLFGPVNGFILLTTVATIVPVGVFMLINISCVVYYLRERREEFNWFIHAAVPIFGTVFLLPVLLTALGMGRTLLRFIQPLPYPISLCGPILGAWYFIGLVYLLYLSKRHPRRIQETARIFVD